MTTLAPRTRTIPASTAPARVAVQRSPRTAVWHAAATAVIWLTSLFVVALWVAGGGITATLGFNAETLTTLGRLTGLVVGEPAALPGAAHGAHPAVRARLRSRRDHADASLRRLLVVLAAWAPTSCCWSLGYAATAAVNPFVQLWQFVWDYPGMLLATAGTLLHPARGRHLDPSCTPASCGTSRGTSCTSTPTSASGSPSRTSCGPVRTSSPLRSRPHTGGRSGRWPRHPSWSSASACR